MTTQRIPDVQAALISDLLRELGQPVTDETTEGFYGNHGNLVDAVVLHGDVADLVELRTACGLPLTT